MPPTKICLICHQEKDIAEFPKWRRICRQCLNKQAMIYYYAHQAKCQSSARKSMARKRKLFPEEVRRRAREYRVKNKEHINAKDRLERPARRRARIARNPEAVRLKDKANNQIRRARLQNSPINDLSPEQIQEILSAKGNRCDYCGKKRKNLTIDHITALVNGGNNTLWNVTVACLVCNSSKGIKGPLKAVQPLLLTISPPKNRKRS